jgi:hypothetical protein
MITLGGEESIILKRILKRTWCEKWSAFICKIQRRGPSKHSKEYSSSIIGGEFLDLLSDYQIYRTVFNGVSGILIKYTRIPVSIT